MPPTRAAKIVSYEFKYQPLAKYSYLKQIADSLKDKMNEKTEKTANGWSDDEDWNEQHKFKPRPIS